MGTFLLKTNLVMRTKFNGVMLFNCLFVDFFLLALMSGQHFENIDFLGNNLSGSLKYQTLLSE